jgi:trans-aconitate 2-methyltransferase
MTWSAAQYSRFETERNRPVVDLLSHVLDREIRRAVDLGCGPGNSTEILRDRFPNAAITGIDTSPDMIIAARRRLPEIVFEIADIVTWRASEPPNLILANAALQWVPDHERLFPALLANLARGGQLAVQTPDNLNEASHRLMRKVAKEDPWAAKLAGATEDWSNRHQARWYWQLLRSACTSLDIWQTTYFHVLAGGPAAIVEWFKGSALRPFLASLDAAERDVFLGRYLAEITTAYPAQPDGSVLLPFPRLFLVATI